MANLTDEAAVNLSDRDRLIVLEVKMEGLEGTLRTMSVDLAAIKEAAHMGKGAWWLLLRLGAMIAAIFAAAGWLFDKLHHG